ncbi:TonB-dependent receptor domain-containing protein [Thalassotalea castellviae]|uniref:TonB-dependent receptor n=1 Tax=Thalassotalea castellviae TaxID=3075612 RepID=A0ABU2ZX76_9GAMM|nr:TonB-dependent receptor [Thalassotalea sp. W431]MDT0602530.1 TonB-dependent receptor [Thalassotalea sp. W431]
MKKATYKKLILSTLAMAICSSLNAAEKNNAEEVVTKGIDFETIVVTGSVGKGKTVMASSVSVSSMSEDQIEIATPRSSAEAFRNIPGVRAEASGGDGNANLAVRGLPVAAGGAKFMQIQEDGLPILQFGDIAFGNTDIFLRIDSTMASIDAIRGGSASTLATNAPGGIINIVSKTGESESGSVATTIGLDYDSTRTDFEFGGELNDSTYFHIGGFYRQGEGVRETGFTGNKGGQIKANITKEFDDGYVRLYLKHLDDTTTAYLPMPIHADGSSVKGFDASAGTPHTPYHTSMLTTDGAGNGRLSDMRNGMSPKVDALGFEAVFDLGNDWSVENRMRISRTEGSFTSPFPESIQGSQTLADSLAGAGATLTYANGPQAGNAYTADNLMRVHSFDVEMTDLDFMVNDFKLTKTINDTSFIFGLYNSHQNIQQSWLWNSYLYEVKGNDAALVDVTAADGTAFSDNGVIAYGVPAWGNCCTRNYDLAYTIQAPYAAFSTSFDNINIDGSVRYDSGTATGSYAGAAQSTVDMNGDGVIHQIEQSVSNVNNAAANNVNYDWGYISYSLGANLQINDDLATFARLSHGATANADRLAFGKIDSAGVAKDEDIYDEVDQLELGVKFRQDELSIFATAFFAETQEQNFEATSQKFFDREYESKGIEVESTYYIGDFDVRANLTWTDSEIVKDAINPTVVGNTPRRQADLVYSITGRYNLDEGSVGANIIGTTDSYAQDGIDQNAPDALKLDGYVQVNAFAQYLLSESFSVSLNINNLFDTVGITEAEEAFATSAKSIIRGRSIQGRSTTLSLKYEF